MEEVVFSSMGGQNGARLGVLIFQEGMSNLKNTYQDSAIVMCQ